MKIPCCDPLLEEPLPESEAADLAGLFKALSDPTRLRLLSLIAERGEVCACELVEPLRLKQPTVSHHLKVLFEAGLLHKERRGRWIHYQVNETMVGALRDALAPARVTT